MRIRLPRAHTTTARELGRDPAAWLAFGLGSGLSPVAPGTWGALLGLAPAWALRLAGMPVYALATAVLFLAGVWLCGHTARRLGVHDHPGINIDEVFGQMVACAFVPLDWRWFLLAFVLFRVLDIVKPWPISWLDKHLRGGLGIMVDDGVAGLGAGVLLWAIVQAVGRGGG